LTVDVIAKVAERKITIANAVKLLNKSRRTVERYLQRYRSHGLQFVVHGNTGSEPVNKTPDRLKQKVQSLIREKYYDLNLLHLAEMLESHEHIVVKRETLRKWAHDIHHVKRAKRRRSRVHKRRERMEAPGLMLQMNGSTHRWLGDRKSCLIAMIDDANSDIHAEFFPSETTEGCMKVMRSVVEKFGLFKTLYVDRAGIFGGPKRRNFSQMQRACEELGIEIIFASSPQGKGRIERAFDTLQDRLIPELRLNNITDMTGANSYLHHVFIPQFWRKNLVVKSRKQESEYTPVSQYTNLDEICITKVYRKIRNDHTFSYGGKLYFTDSPLKHSIANQKIEIRTGKNKRFDAYFAGRKLQVTEVTEPEKLSSEDNEIQKKLEVLALAEKLGNVSEASRLSGISRDTIYRHRKLIKQGGIHSLKRKETSGLRHKNCVDIDIERTVIEHSIQYPHLGQQKIAKEIRSKYGLQISPNGVRSIWLRQSMNTIEQRMVKASVTVSA
jgi:transposase